MDSEESLSQPLPPLIKSPSRNSLDESISWFHGKITRDEAEKVLKSGGSVDGLFLVRESTSSPGDYVLSLIHNEVPIHYQIRRHGEDAFFSIDDGPIVHGLEMLISYYQEDDQGLSTKLGHMCKAQAPPSDSRRHGRTNLLHRATKEGEVTVVRELLKSGYHNLDAKNQEGQTALHLACLMGYEDILDLLLNAGANSNILDGNGLSPLHYACQCNRSSTVKILLKTGANPQLRATESGWVALHYAASYGFIDIIKILLSLNLPCHPRSNYNETPFDLALKNNHRECYILLKNHIPLSPISKRSEWFHENLDRERTVQCMQSHGLKDGMFLVRRSTRKKEIYVLSLVHNTNTFNYEIQSKDSFYFIDDGPYLESLDHVVDYYTRIADGLPTNLLYPVPPNLDSCLANNPTKKKESTNTYSNIEITRCHKPSSEKANIADDYNSRPNLICRESLRLAKNIQL